MLLIRQLYTLRRCLQKTCLHTEQLSWEADSHSATTNSPVYMDIQNSISDPYSAPHKSSHVPYFKTSILALRSPILLYFLSISGKITSSAKFIYRIPGGASTHCGSVRTINAVLYNTVLLFNSTHRTNDSIHSTSGQPVANPSRKQKDSKRIRDVQRSHVG